MILAHALPAVTSVLGQARQSEIVVVALRTIARMQDESVHAVFVLVFFGNEGVIIADAYFIRTGAVTVPDRKKETEGFFFSDELRLRSHWNTDFCMKSSFTSTLNTDHIERTGEKHTHIG